MATMYVREEPDGFFTLRQERYRARLTGGKGHPHDVCAVARSRAELRSMCEAHWPDVDYGADEIAPGEFSRAILAGYQWSAADEDEVTATPWRACTPDGDDLGEFVTERAAAEACDRHRMFGSADLPDSFREPDGWDGSGPLS